ncbi:Putative D-lactate dehydrogenase (Cytochrome) [Tolypocladium paradoxum]|uniref:D-lactate dehydrogenase (Cytochrome) n=1 Tax=Tolypocladium paradoxum TaxID=94208 RepID=A0A2S4L5N1_9HYPO|nr:Putative D-lactate dehydrogenase (Cytochrome) [Tolypocladium paradoxum]
MFSSKGFIGFSADRRCHAATARPHIRSAARSLRCKSRRGYVTNVEAVTYKESPKGGRSYLALLLSTTAAGAGAWLIGESKRTPDDSRIAVKELEAILGEDSVSIDDEILKVHGYSEWSIINVDRLPVAVVYPSTTEDVSISRLSVPRLPRTNETELTFRQSLTRADRVWKAIFSAPFGGISVDFRNMNQILEFQKEQ